MKEVECSERWESEDELQLRQIIIHCQIKRRLGIRYSHGYRVTLKSEINTNKYVRSQELCNV